MELNIEMFIKKLIEEKSMESNTSQIRISRKQINNN